MCAIISSHIMSCIVRDIWLGCHGYHARYNPKTARWNPQYTISQLELPYRVSLPQRSTTTWKRTYENTIILTVRIGVQYKKSSKNKHGWQLWGFTVGQQIQDRCEATFHIPYLGWFCKSPPSRKFSIIFFQVWCVMLGIYHAFFGLYRTW